MKGLVRLSGKSELITRNRSGRESRILLRLCYQREAGDESTTYTEEKTENILYKVSATSCTKRCVP